jgi:hypothetical protein
MSSLGWASQQIQHYGQGLKGHPSYVLVRLFKSNFISQFSEISHHKKYCKFTWICMGFILFSYSKSWVFRKLLGNHDVIWNFPKSFNNLCMEYLKNFTISMFLNWFMLNWRRMGFLFQRFWYWKLSKKKRKISQLHTKKEIFQSFTVYSLKKKDEKFLPKKALDKNAIYLIRW